VTVLSGLGAQVCGRMLSQERGGCGTGAHVGAERPGQKNVRWGVAARFLPWRV